MVGFSEREQQREKGRLHQAGARGWESSGHVIFSPKSVVEMDKTVALSDYCPPVSMMSSKDEALMNVPKSSFLKDPAKSSGQLRNDEHLVFQESPSYGRNKHSHREQLFMSHFRRFQRVSFYLFCSSSLIGDKIQDFTPG